jgi:hypothetical protein
VSLVIRDFLGEFLPGMDARAVALAADLIETTLTQVGSSFSETERTDEEIAACADAMADMFCAYLASLSNQVGGRRSSLAFCLGEAATHLRQRRLDEVGGKRDRARVHAGQGFFQTIADDERPGGAGRVGFGRITV